MTQANALAGLNPAQRQAVEMTGGPVLVIAGAGSGKTRTLVHRVAHLLELEAEPESILLLTFTRRAAAEMIQRARSMHPQAGRVAGGTFHSVCHRILRQNARAAGLPVPFTIIDQADQEQVMRQAVEDLGLKTRGDKRFPRARALVSLVSRSRNLEMGLSETLRETSALGWEYESEVLEAARGYAKAKQEQGLLDYDDLLFRAEDLFRNDPELGRRISSRWRHVLVDEYQDTNAVQARLMGHLARESQSLMVVGDDAQSIYRFRGARYRNILDFPDLFPGTQLVKLEENYRSTQSILDLSNGVIAGAAERFEKRLFTSNQGGPRPELKRPRDERGQSRLVVERVKELSRQGTRLDQMAVLFRSGRDSYDLEQELAASQIPFVKYGGQRFLEAAHIKDLLAHLRILANPEDYLAWQRAFLLIPGVGVKTAQGILAQVTRGPDPARWPRELALAPAVAKNPGLRELAALLEDLSDPAQAPLDLVLRAMEYYEPLCREAYPDYPRRLRDLEEMPSLARNYAELEEFLADTVLEPPQPAPGQEAAGKLTLSTVHSAKGMEWDQVFVIWATDGRLPSAPCLDDPEALEEERRLLYVACTRAAKGLVLLAPGEYYLRGAGRVPQSLSRFLEDALDGGLVEAPKQVFPVAEPAAQTPASRGSGRQDRPFPVGGRVSHNTFGMGKVMGYKGDAKIMVNFPKVGLKILMLEYAGLTPAE